ncbi:MAG: hypothetical protein U0230_09700 [Polyangiales bacterium]
MSRPIPEFPFVGAGSASYFEWAEVQVRFTREPSDAERRALAEDVPPPLSDLAWKGSLLVASSEQGVGRTIRAAYTGSRKGSPKALGMQNRFAHAGEAAEARFDAHIEAWLAAAHAVVPIRVAYRRQDFEAGGTKLDDWHRASVAQVPSVVAVLVSEARTEDAKLAARLASWAEAEQVDLEPQLAQAVAALEQAADRAEEEAREQRWARTQEAKRAAKAELEMASTKTQRAVVSASELEAGLAALEATLPAFVKRLRKLDPAELELARGATDADLDAAEAQLGIALLPEHRALLAVFDGGRIGSLVLPGTSARGGRGRDDLVATSKVYAAGRGVVWAATVALAPDELRLQARFLNGKPYAILENQGGVTIKSSKKIDTLLDVLVKESARTRSR